MPKSQFISPNELLKKSNIEFESIKVADYDGINAPDIDVSKMGEMLFSMCVIRETEDELALAKTDGRYSGPIHLCQGEEGAEVGQAFALGKDDIIFGSHRSHGDMIAKSFAYIYASDDNLTAKLKTEPILFEIIKDYGNNIKDKAKMFALVGMLSEIFNNTIGFQKGIAGSMHVFFTPFGVYPSNAVVGASAPIAVGAGLYKKINNQKGIVVCNIGDGAMGCGVVYEAMNFACMDQFTELWESKGGLPVLFNFLDNGYGMGGQTRGETMAYDKLARVGAGVTPNQMYSERIDGNDVFAVYDATIKRKKLLENGQGACMLDVVTYRYEGHSQSDKMLYREQSEIDEWRKYDPILRMENYLLTKGIFDKNGIEEIRNKARNFVKKAFEYVDIGKKYNQKINLKELMYNNQTLGKITSTAKDLIGKKEDNIRYSELKIVNRKKKGDLTIKDALFEAVLDRFYFDDLLISYGEDVRDWGGVCSVYKGLTDSVKYPRLFNAPISEACIVSSAIGYAMLGGRVVIEIMFADFILRASDEIFNQLAKWQSISGGKLKLPVVIRTAIGNGYGTQHSQDLSSFCMAIPGLKIVYPSSPYDAKGLLNSAFVSSDPVLFFESQKLYKINEMFEDEIPDSFYTVPFGVPILRNKGTDVTIVTVGNGVYTAIEVEKIIEKNNLSADIIDVRTLSECDYSLIYESVKKTGRVAVITEDGCLSLFGLKVVESVVTNCFEYLKKPPIVISPNIGVVPPNGVESDYYPSIEEIAEKIKNMLKKESKK